jgi:ubiquinone biosynthesis protein
MGRHAVGAGSELIGHQVRGGPRPQAGPAHLRAALEELGPTFVKLGQLLSGRSDLLPAGYQEALSRLRDRVQPVPAAAVRDQIEQSLGRPVSDAYAAFEWEPIASASVGQVHAAVLPDGRAAVVKVRRPGICPQIEADLDAIDRCAAFVQVGPVALLRRSNT